MAREDQEAFDPNRMQAERALAEVKRHAKLLAGAGRRWPGWAEWSSMALAIVFFVLAFRIYDRLPSPDLKDLWSVAWMVAFGFSLISQTQVWILAQRVDALAELVETFQPPASRAA